MITYVVSVLLGIRYLSYPYNLWNDKPRPLGGDYLIPVCQGEISTRPAGTDFTLWLHGGVRFHPSKEWQFSIWYLYRFVYIFLWFSFVSMWYITFSSLKRAEAITWDNFVPIFTCNHIWFVKEFLALPGSRQNGTEFHSSQPGSCNHHPSKVYNDTTLREILYYYQDNIYQPCTYEIL